MREGTAAAPGNARRIAAGKQRRETVAARARSLRLVVLRSVDGGAATAAARRAQEARLLADYKLYNG